MFRSSNPVLNQDHINEAIGHSYAGTNTMTLQGTAIKTSFLVALVGIAGAVPWTLIDPMEGEAANMQYAFPFMIGGMISSFILGIFIYFSPRQSTWAAPLYAILEGLFVGAVSAWVQAAYLTAAPGIIFQAVCLTFGTLFAMMTAYNTGLIKATEKFKTGVFAATGAICLVYLISFVMRMFGSEMPFLHDSGVIGIGISVVIVVVAALFLIIDFDMIEQNIKAGAPKYMEWYGAYALLVTLVWLYLEILRLLMKLSDRD